MVRLEVTSDPGEHSLGGDSRWAQGCLALKEERGDSWGRRWVKGWFVLFF